MAKIIVYGTAMGTSFRVHWALREMGLDYETKAVDFKTQEHKSPAFLALNPMGQVPVIDVDGFVLPESVAITHYLATKFAQAMLGNSLEEQANGLRWSLWCLLNVNPPFGALASVNWTGVELAPEVKTEKLAALAKNLTILEAQLAGKDFLLGAFSIADVNVRSTMQYGEMIGFDFTPYPNVVAWMSRCAERPGYKAAKA
jgi:glutathione S-transferase